MASQSSKKKAAPAKTKQGASATTTRKKSAAKKQPVKKKSAVSVKNVKDQTVESTKPSNESRVLPGLLQGLQSVFDKIHKDSRKREDHQEKSLIR